MKLRLYKFDELLGTVTCLPEGKFHYDGPKAQTVQDVVEGMLYRGTPPAQVPAAILRKVGMYWAEPVES